MSYGRLAQKLQRVKGLRNFWKNRAQRRKAKLKDTEEILERAMKYIVLAKEKHYPNTTNSFVDDLIVEYKRKYNK